MKIIFFGNSPYSLIGAKILHEKLGINLIVTKPDRPNKKGVLQPSALTVFANEQNIPVLTVNKLDDQAIAQIAEEKPDFFVVEDYGLILPQRLLEIPKYAPLNVHHSLLPKYRGPAPAPFALLAGETTTGVSIIHMNDKVDAGDLYAQEPYAIEPNDTTDSILTVLNNLGGNLVVQVIQDIVAGTAKRHPQNHEQAIFTHYMKKSDGFIDIENLPDPQKLDQMTRAYYPWPTVWTKLKMANGTSKIVKLLPNKHIQMEGKNPVSLKDFINGYPELAEQITKLFPKEQV